MIRALGRRALIVVIGLGVALLAPSCGGGGGNPPPTPVAVTISPSTASLGFGSTQQFNATVTGTSNAAVTWSVNKIQGGNSTVGTISVSGLYAAPSAGLSSGPPAPFSFPVAAGQEMPNVDVAVPAIPANSTVTVTATSVADPSKSASAKVTVAALSLIAVGMGNTAGSVGVNVKQGNSANLFLVGNGILPGTTYKISGSAASPDVTVTQPTTSDFSQTTDGLPAVNVNINVSPTAALGPRSIIVTNAGGEMAVFVGGVLITPGP